MRPSRVGYGALAILVLAWGTAASQDALPTWSRFRGPAGQGWLPQAHLPATLTEDSIRWKTALSGSGYGSPVLWEETLFVASYETEEASLVVEAVARGDGKLNWRWSMPLTAPSLHRMNSPVAGTPAVDAQHLYLLVAEPEHVYLLALDHAGRLVWKRDFGPWRGQHGFTASPIVWEQRVYFLLSQESTPPETSPASCEAIAVDAATGEVVWKVALAAGLASYAAPLVWNRGTTPPCLLGASTGEGIFALDLASGRHLWNVPCFAQRTVGSPVAQGELIFGNNGSGNGGNYLVAVDASREPPRVRYEVRQQMGYVPTVLPLGSQVYVVADQGVVSCLAAETGDVIWQQRVPGRYFSSPVSDGSHFYLINTDGLLSVMAVGPEPRLVSQLKLGEACQSTPAVDTKQLYVRTVGHLICLGASKPSGE